MKTTLLFPLLVYSLIFSLNLFSQIPATPTILEITEDDRAAVMFWNSKTATYQDGNDPDEQQGIYSYRVEWGPVNSGFIHQEVTPYKVFQVQPLTPGTVYQARVFALDSDGKKSTASNVMQFQHSDVKVSDMRSRLNGFFDDLINQWDHLMKPNGISRIPAVIGQVGIANISTMSFMGIM